MQTAQVYQTIRFVKRGICFVLLTLLSSSFFVHSAFATDDPAATAIIDQALLAKGYMLRSPNGTAFLRMAAGGLSEPSMLTLQPAVGTYPGVAGAIRVSDVWTFDATQLHPAAAAKGQLQQPFVAGLLPWSNSLFRKRVYFYDRNKQVWNPVRSARDATTGFITASIKLSYAQIAVFEDASAVEGKGSWFRHTLHDTAASNDFPLGSKLKVTDLDTKKSVTVVVRSTGPFVAGRVIDIAKPAFQQLRPASAGIARIRAELDS